MTHLLLVTDDASFPDRMTRHCSAHPSSDVIRVSTGSSALLAVASGAPDVVVVDDHARGSTVVDVCRRIRATSAELGLIVTTPGKVEQRLRAFAAGADECLLKPFDVRELWARIQALARRCRGASDIGLREAAQGPTPAGAVDASERRMIALTRRYRLSAREQEILLHMVRGVPLKEIGDRVGCAYSSVRTHVRRMGTKLGCSGSRELVLKFFAEDPENGNDDRAPTLFRAVAIL